jgi:beta-galactosidase
MASRRNFLGQTAIVGLTALAASPLWGTENAATAAETKVFSLCGEWSFRTDPDDLGTKQSWFGPTPPAAGWRVVTVPHTWQIDSSFADYRGGAWYQRFFNVRASWKNSAVRIEFEAVFHTATVWVNGQWAGDHARKGYTAFTLDVTHLLRWGEDNIIVVHVDNAFNEHMLPRGRSSDWAHDGGIYRPVQLLITPRTFVERVDVKAAPDFAHQDANLTLTALIRNTSFKFWTGRASFRVVDDQTGLTVLANAETKNLALKSGSAQTLTLQTTLPKAKLWHFDHPNLYRLDFFISDGREAHEFTTTFGVRQLEIKNGKFYFNDEPVRLMGVERMAGSNPEFGMAEPDEWITHDHDDLKHLNCVFTRVHWPQDKRVLDCCDRRGILMQTEVPTWGPRTFQGMGAGPDADIMENGLEQLREMIARDRNHPSVVVWGLCNEIGGQDPPAYQFAKRMLEEARKIDPNRLCAYASHTLRENPQRDVAGLMDFIETNEYFGSWHPGTTETLSRHLDELHQVFPGKPIVISEYGYCACTDERPEGDARRVDILRSHDEVIRSKDYMGGTIFFCYNDYRTHIGDRGVGALQQRVHGVVDVYGARKSSYSLLRQESSPVESLSAQNHLTTFHLQLRTRRTLPAYTLRGYKLRGIFYGQGEVPVERQEVELPDVPSGGDAKVELKFTQSSVPLHVRFDVMRPTGFSAYCLDWKP